MASYRHRFSDKNRQIGTRFSRRIRMKTESGAIEGLENGGVSDDINTTEPEVPSFEDIRITYDTIPEDSSQLDDYEFQAFAELKKWRLVTCRDLQIEPYKIFQNRTLCEMVRRRRNDPNWATGKRCSSAEFMSSIDSESEPSGLSEFDRIVNDLLMCFGIGPSKSKLDGFAHQALQILNSDIVCKLIQGSIENHTLG